MAADAAIIHGIKQRRVSFMTGNNSYPTTGWFVETLGVDRAFDILDVFGNQRVYIPRSDGRIWSEFMLTLHDDERRPLIDRCGGEIITIPGSLTFCCHYLAFVRDESTASIARRYRINRNSVQKALKRDLPFPADFAASEARFRSLATEREAVAS